MDTREGGPRPRLVSPCAREGPLAPSACRRLAVLAAPFHADRDGIARVRRSLHLTFAVIVAQMLFDNARGELAARYTAGFC